MLSPNFRASQMALVVKNLPASAGDLMRCGFNPGSGRSPGEGHGNPLQYFSMERLWTEDPGRLYSPWTPRESDTTE